MSQELCPKCQVALRPVNLRGIFASTMAVFDGREASLEKLSQSGGFVCPACPSILGWNGVPTPVPLRALAPNSSLEPTTGKVVYQVEAWRID